MRRISSLSLGEGASSHFLQLSEILMTNATLKLAALTAQANAATSAPDAKKPAPVLYLNVGYEHPTLGRINLPFNLALDHMQFKDTNGGDEWKLKATLANDLLQDLREAIQGLGDGEGMVVEGLTVEAYKRKAQDTAPPADALDAARAGRPGFMFSKK